MPFLQSSKISPFKIPDPPRIKRFKFSDLIFCKSISVQSLSKKGLQSIGDDIINLAMSEGLEAHAKAVSVRIEE